MVRTRNENEEPTGAIVRLVDKESSHRQSARGGEMFHTLVVYKSAISRPRARAHWLSDSSRRYNGGLSADLGKIEGG